MWLSRLRRELITLRDLVQHDCGLCESSSDTRQLVPGRKRRTIVDDPIDDSDLSELGQASPQDLASYERTGRVQLGEPDRLLVFEQEKDLDRASAREHAPHGRFIEAAELSVVMPHGDRIRHSTRRLSEFPTP